MARDALNPSSIILKNNLSGEDTWHDNCVWWRGDGMPKSLRGAAVPPPPISKPGEQKPIGHRDGRGYLRELTSALPSPAAPDRVPLRMLSSAAPA